LKQKKSKKHCCFQQQRVSDTTKLFLWGRGSNHQSQHCCDMHGYLVWQAPFLIHKRHHLGTLLVYGPTRYRQGRSDFLTLPVNVVQQVVNGEWWISGLRTIEVLNEGCSLGLLVPAATVSCSSSAAYRLCNCYYFFLSLTLLFYSPLCDFSILHAYVNVITPREITFTSSILHVFTST